MRAREGGKRVMGSFKKTVNGLFDDFLVVRALSDAATFTLHNIILFH